MFSHSSGGWKTEIKVPAGWVSPEVSQMDRWLSSRCVLTGPFLCAHALLVSLPLLLKILILWIRVSSLSPHLILIISVRALFPNTVALGVRTSIEELGGKLFSQQQGSSHIYFFPYRHPMHLAPFVEKINRFLLHLQCCSCY